MTDAVADGFLMKELLEPATGIVQEKRSQARLVRISGFGLRHDGRIMPSAPQNWTCRWEFAFRSPAKEQGLFVFHSVLYLQGAKPVYTDAAGNVQQAEPFDEETVVEMADSDELADLFASIDGFAPMAGHDDDWLLITMRRPLDPVAHMHNRHGQSAMIDPLGREVINVF